MCLALLALAAHPRYPLVLAANRDEFHARPTAPASWWKEALLAGRDLSAGGTWLGVRRDGCFALLTNIREPHRHNPAAPSRGSLVTALLVNGGEPVATMRNVVAGATEHNGFNLLAGSPRGAAWGSNRAEGVKRLAIGVHGLSNAQLDTPWPKVERTRAVMTSWATSGDDGFDALWVALADRALAADAELPKTGVSLDWERILSAPFIVSETYGTRCSTIFAIDREGNARFTERSFDAAGSPSGEVEERFRIADFH
jgi:uncharacterized protein with NRDE domain